MISISKVCETSKIQIDDLKTQNDLKSRTDAATSRTILKANLLDMNNFLEIKLNKINFLDLRSKFHACMLSEFAKTN